MHFCAGDTVCRKVYICKIHIYMFDKIKKAFRKKKYPDHAATLSVGIEGMSCDHCAMNIRNRFESVSGVYEAYVRYPEGQGTFVYDPDQLTCEQIIAIIEEGGSYKVKR